MGELAIGGLYYAGTSTNGVRGQWMENDRVETTTVSSGW